MAHKMTILVCGDRNWSNAARLALEVLKRHPTFIIEGGATGADAAARALAEDCGIPYKTYKANWERFGRAAGPIRNLLMLAEGKPDLVLAFHNDLTKSKGTLDMVSQALARGIPTEVISERDQPLDADRVGSVVNRILELNKRKKEVVR